ncbi:hypothetical protein TK50_09780 [Micromonospora haikouensis]|uniref:Uncharacterized protein n=1 Tax=Micromonospora haikouensis TaxID=686309 RepID=A0A0D0X876_9ACTN|nr:hypothetical protein TK50_09780 [Micromonospora haikouensis]
MDPPRRGSFGSSLLVALGWYVTVFAAVFVGSAGVPTNPNQDCSVIFACLTPQEGFVLAAIVGAPVLAAMLLTTLAITALLARRVPSPALAGTLSVSITVGLAVVAGGFWQAAR